MTEGEFLKDWVNDTKNEYNEKDHHEYSEREVMDMLRKWKEINDIELRFYKDIILSIQRILKTEEPEYFKNARIEAFVLGKRES